MASRAINKLTDMAVRKAVKPGLYGDGGKLYLRVGSTSQKSWVFLFQWAGKTREMGLGSLQDVSLAEARKRRQAQVDILARGENPLEVREAERAAVLAVANAAPRLTFSQCAAEVIKVRGPTGADNQKAWLKRMQESVGVLADMDPAKITVQHVVDAVKPHWHRAPTQANAMLRGIATVLGWAKAKGGLIPDPWSNPAQWGGNLEWLLERRDYEEKHQPALPYKMASVFMARLRAYDRGAEVCRLAVELCVLTATRKSEARRARLSEFDEATRVWTIPGERMKQGLPHRVPLSDAAWAVVERARALAADFGSPFLFPSFGREGCVHGKTMNEYVERLSRGLAPATIHGFRSGFKDWSREVGRVDDALSEECLAHVVGSKVRRAYARDDNLENRRPVMAAWAEFLAVEWKENIVPLAAGRRAA